MTYNLIFLIITSSAKPYFSIGGIYTSFLSYFLDPIKQLFEIEKEMKEAIISIEKIIIYIMTKTKKQRKLLWGIKFM